MPHSRIQREAQTVEAMLRLYCRGRHGGAPRELCPACRELADYARRRLQHCSFQEGKTVCARCAVHCYPPAMRQKIKEVMRTAGPRMLTHHPILLIQHWLDQRRKTPE